MTTKKPIDKLTIKGFKSIRNLDSFRLKRLNVLIGSNGSGKSNFVSYFRMLGELVHGRLQGKVFHFRDTSDTAGVRRVGALHDNEHLRSDASNLAAFLCRLREESPDVYKHIRKTVRLAIPSFHDFTLKPQKLRSGEQQIRLLWRQKDSDYALWPSQLSDGSIRFICLVTALLQPDPPSTIISEKEFKAWRGVYSLGELWEKNFLGGRPPK